MPLNIICQDITKMKVDAIVNPTNTELYPAGGTDLSIHKAAGQRLFEECRKIGSCAVGEAKITPAFDLPSRFVIHTVGPIWRGDENSSLLLISCYRNCLQLAKEMGFESLAFPLISAGTYGFPKDKVLKIAIDAISSFLFYNEMTVYLLVYDKESYELSEKLFSKIESYIDDNYIFTDRLCGASEYNRAFESLDCCSAAMPVDSAPPEATIEKRRTFSIKASRKKKSLEEFIKLDESFALKLTKLIDAKGMSDVECYKKANVSKQTWHKLMTDKSYKPGKKTAISFAIALELTLEETQNLLSSVGFILSDSSLFDVIIKYCLENEIYDVFEIDSALFKYDQETLFSKY